MIKALMLKEIKANYRILLIFTLIITMYGSIIVAMYDPTLGESLNMMAQSMPELFAAFGMKDPGLTLIDFVANYLYGFILVVIPFIYIVLMSYRLIGRYIDKGSMAYLLAMPHGRVKVAVSQLLVLIMGIVFLDVYVTCLVILCSHWMFQEMIPCQPFIQLNLGLLCLHLFFIGFCYFFTCTYNEMKWSVGLGAGLGIFFILVQMLSQVSDKIDWLKYLTPLTLFDAKGLIAGESFAFSGAIVLFVSFLVLVLIAVRFFKKRDLSL